VPAVLAAAGIGNRWVLGGAAAVAAVGVVFGTVWQDRYKRLAERRDEESFRTEDGCLVLADGRLLTLLDEVPPAGSVPVLGLVRIHRHEGNATSPARPGLGRQGCP
jgi:hypothetical protein